MALKQLTEDQIRDWTLEQKDRWWFENVWKGNMPQLTVRSAVTGMMIGGILSLTNLYIGAKTGWTLGVGITSVILAFAMFKVLKQLGLGSEFTVLENNCMQSIATAAGYMTAPMISSLAAYMMITGEVIPMGTTMAWITALAVLGVLFAFPLKRRFINDEQHPFPEGRAAGVVMDALHTGDAREGMFKAKLLAICGVASALVKVMSSHVIMTKIKLGFLAVPEYLDAWIYKFWTPKLLDTELRQLTVRVEPDVVMFAAGGLMGIRTGVSLLVGAVINYCFLAPWIIRRGDITGVVGEGGIVEYGFRNITIWALWGGVAMMTTASLFAFFSKPKILVTAFVGLFGRGKRRQGDLLKHIELPMWVFFLGIPLVGAVVVYLAYRFFGVEIWMGIVAVPLIFVFSLIAVNSTALTAITPTGALGKLTQLTYGVLAPKNITTNIATASITGEVAGHASNLLMDIKPGYMLGAKPRQQAVGHVLGILAGALISVPIFYMVFLQIGPRQLIDGDYPPVATGESKSKEGAASASKESAGKKDPASASEKSTAKDDLNAPRELVTEQYPMPSAVIWKGVAEVLTKGIDQLPVSARWAALVGAIVGIWLEILRMLTKGRSWISGVGVGLAMMIPFSTCFAMFLGSFFFWIAGLKWKDPNSKVHEILVKNQEPICAGLIAGGALMGIVVALLENFVL